MTLIVDVAADGIRVPLSARRVREVARQVLRAEGVREALLSIAFVSRRMIAALHRKHLGARGATDVITFAMRGSGRSPSPVIGDVYISPEVARENARRFGSGVREELARLVVHGTLHAVGHDHPEGDARQRSPMWRRQEELLDRARMSGAW